MSLQSHSLQRICELNAHGILALAQGKAGKCSILALKEAMITLDLLCSLSPQGSENSADLPFAFRTVPVPGLHDDNMYIVDHAFLVSPAITLNNSISLTATDMAVVCAILTFNMALIYHQLGRESGDSRKLNTSYRLYCNCSEITGAVVGIPRPSVSDTLDVMQMLAMNNAAQIQYAMASFAESDSLMAQVRRRMLQFQNRDDIPEPFSSETNLFIVIPRESLDEINLNAAVCIRPSTAPTA